MPEASTAVLVRPPTAVNGTVHDGVQPCPPRRTSNAAKRLREYLTPAEVEQLVQVARVRGRYGARDAAMILIAYRHGLRVAELVGLRWEQVDFGAGLLHVNRVKRGTPSVHPLRGPELRVLRAMRRTGASDYVFTTERGAPMTAAGFRKLLARTGAAAGLDRTVQSLAGRRNLVGRVCGVDFPGNPIQKNRVSLLTFLSRSFHEDLSL